MTTPRQKHCDLINDLVSDLIQRADECERRGKVDQAKNLRDHIAALKASNNLTKNDLAELSLPLPSIFMPIPEHLHNSFLATVESTIELFDEARHKLFDGAVKPSAIYLLGAGGNLKDVEKEKLEERLRDALKKGNSKPALHINFGDDGALSITPTSITFIGKTHEMPEAILAAMQHAKLHWGRFEFITNQSAAYPKDYYFRFAVAAEMVGVPIVGYEIPPHRRVDAEKMKGEWKKHFDKLGKFTSASPGRPKRGSARPPGLEGEQPVVA